MAEGPALDWLREGKKKKPHFFNTSCHNFGHATGTKMGIKMCRLATRDPDLTAILPKANKFWKSNTAHNSCPFGSTYADVTSSTWSNQFLTTRYTWAFTQHILWCQHKTGTHPPNTQIGTIPPPAYT
eukprot:783305-Ditylum_brightwellii.AAC.1